MKPTSETYCLSYLAKHPLTREIVSKHLRSVDMDQVRQVHATLHDLLDTNMGGGIGYENIMNLMKEIDTVHFTESEVSI